MNNRRIRMPWGAALACFLVTALVITGIVTAVKFFSSEIKTPIAENVTPSPQLEEPDNTKYPVENTARPADIIPHSEQASHNVSESEYDMIDRSMNAVVSIDVSIDATKKSNISSSGSGVIVSENGYILTCNHVIANAKKVYIYLNDERAYEAEIVGNDRITDLAVLKINETGLTYAEPADLSSLRIGEGVYAIGNALGELSNTYTSGSVSGLDRTIEIDGQSMNLLQTDAAINKGNSGGGLFRASDGRLIGIVNAKSFGSGIEGLGFAIPSNLAFSVLHDLINYGFVTGRPYLGIIVSNEYSLFVSDLPRVASVDSGSPAEKSGFRVNDIILAVDGTSVFGMDFVQLINQYKIGDKITVTVLRGNASVDLTVVLGERSTNGN